MQLIIAEKPSLARNIAGALGAKTRRNGYIEGDGFLVTWAFGHLFSLYDIEDYTGGAGQRWKLQGLPFFPSAFRFKLRQDANKQTDDGVRKQFEVIRSLCAREDVDGIVNAGDADREGEIIVRLCVQNACKRDVPCRRLWLPDQTAETIKAAVQEMQDASAYDRLADEGFARMYMDWLYGVNLTRLATLKSGTLLRVGRVIVPIVKAIYDRDMAIEQFVPSTYYALVSNAETGGEAIRLVSRYKFDAEKRETAVRACRKLNAQRAYVKDKSTKKETLQPGKLFSLSKLQNYLGKKYKMPMDESLAIVQKLYESGYVTYPRTNSGYLATAEKDKVRKLVSVLQGVGYPVAFRDKKTIFDDSKIESHSALTPTYQIPGKDKLSEKERQVYSAILRRFVAVFCAEECKAEKTEITVAVGACEDFALKGTVILQPGWTRFDDSMKTSVKILPDLNVGDEVNIDFHPEEKQTSPPKHYTIETLNNYLKNPFREEKAAAANEDDSEEYRAMFEGLELGTEATRTGIIENAIKSKYIELKKDVYYLLPGGKYLIETLQQMQISMDKYKTSALGQALKKVYHGTMTVPAAVQMAQTEIRAAFSAGENDPDNERYTGFFGEPAGLCPLCGKDVTRGRYGFACTGYKDGCRFQISREIAGRQISLKEARELLINGKTGLLKGFISKTGKPFDAALELENGKVAFRFEQL
ncbi:MAG: topoisomerase C-terminal repeat-containing protein [Clostridia bacterium]|nr:topoisomerase C-terminal repeat-containing protein [Clostridia bacterium]